VALISIPVTSGASRRRKPPIGVGYLIGVVKALKEGKEQFTVEIKLDDGAIKKVPFAFDIAAADNS
jgi:hypothetical protein